jgi:type IV pilus biogenesis protein CpaD/CtpE
MRYALLTIGLTALGLGGCVQGNTVDPDFGVAVRQNIAAQIADPAPNYVRADPPASDGSRTALAQQRYEKGAVIAPVTQSTSTVSAGGGGGGK